MASNGKDAIGGLGEAERLYDAGRLAESYQIFRRYFDRLPFSVEPDHAKYIGMFVRILSELGKRSELPFYQRILETHCQKKGAHPELAYTLAMVYRFLPEPRLESAKHLLEQIIRNGCSNDFKVKTKILLAHLYEYVDGDIHGCRELIESIKPPIDPKMEVFVAIWKAKLARDFDKTQEAEEILDGIFAQIDPETDWYAYYSAKVIQAGLFLKEGRFDETRILISEIRSIYNQRRFKSLKAVLEDLEERIRENAQMGVLQVRTNGTQAKVQYENSHILLRSDSITARLLRLFHDKRHISKDQISTKIYGLPCESEKQEKLVYYHIHALRKKLVKIGVPNKAIISQKNGYRLVPKLKWARG